MVTILSCYNNENCYQDMLLKSLLKQDTKHEVIGIANHDGHYRSAAEAYNTEYTKATGDVLIFCHQDIAFNNTSFIRSIENILEKNPDSIIGLAGIKKDGCVYSNLKYFNNDEYITKKRVQGYLDSVESIDECFIAINRQLFEKIKFNSEICDSWHLYGVELCYHARVKGYNVLVSSIQAYHKYIKGDGLEIDVDFIRTINRMCSVYNKYFKTIYAPCYIVSTNIFLRTLRITKTSIKLKIKGIMRWR